MDHKMDRNTGDGLLLWDMGRSEQIRQEEEKRRLYHLRMSLLRTRFVTGIGMLAGAFYASGVAITYSTAVIMPESTIERIVIGLLVAAGFYALNTIAKVLEHKIKK